jgi:hypothetical protein
MRIYMPEGRAKGSAKRLRKVLSELGVEFTHTHCLHLAVQLLGWRHWDDFLARDHNAGLSPYDAQLSDVEFALRDDFQMNVLASAGLAPIARELLDRANPTGSWAKQTPKSIPMKPAPGYLRFQSSEEQGDSFRRQLENMAKWAEQEGYKLLMN